MSDRFAPLPGAPGGSGRLPAFQPGSANVVANLARLRMLNGSDPMQSKAIQTLVARSRNGSIAAADELRRLGLSMTGQPLAKNSFRTNGKASLASQPVDPVKLAKIEARGRYDNVMASDAVKGREKQAEELLLASCSANAHHKTSGEIIAELRRRPTDAQRDAQIKAGRQAEIDAMWSKAADNVGRMTGDDTSLFDQMKKRFGNGETA